MNFRPAIPTQALMPLGAAVALFVGLSYQGCSSSSNSSMVDKSLITHSYTSEGEIMSLPEAVASKKENSDEEDRASDQRKPLRLIKIKHKAIPNFKNKKGVVVGMMSMAMSFVVPDKISLKEFKKGDQVRFSFDSVWRATPRHQITNIAPLTDTGAK